jgi:hypothetical protein
VAVECLTNGKIKKDNMGEQGGHGLLADVLLWIWVKRFSCGCDEGNSVPNLLFTKTPSRQSQRQAFLGQKSRI